MTTMNDRVVAAAIVLVAAQRRLAAAWGEAADCACVRDLGRRMAVTAELDCARADVAVAELDLMHAVDEMPVTP
jgi:hypothetical protein